MYLYWTWYAEISDFKSYFLLKFICVGFINTQYHVMSRQVHCAAKHSFRLVWFLCYQISLRITRSSVGGKFLPHRLIKALKTHRIISKMHLLPCSRSRPLIQDPHVRFLKWFISSLIIRLISPRLLFLTLEKLTHTWLPLKTVFVFCRKLSIVSSQVYFKILWFLKQ